MPRPASTLSVRLRQRGASLPGVALEDHRTGAPVDRRQAAMALISPGSTGYAREFVDSVSGYQRLLTGYRSAVRPRDALAHSIRHACPDQPGLPRLLVLRQIMAGRALVLHMATALTGPRLAAINPPSGSITPSSTPCLACGK